MNFALSTHWNAARHADGEALVQEILEMGFSHVELGYDLRLELVDGVRRMAAQKAVTVDSLHNYCPVPLGASRGSPELYTMASPNPRERELAVQHTTRTIEFAAEVGARFVVTHAGNVEMDRYSKQLYDLVVAGHQFSPRYESLKLKLQLQREKKAPKQIEFLYAGIAQLLPVLEASNVALAFENLPTWESIPTEIELEELFRHFNSPCLRYWHDIGHGQIRQNMGFINQERWLQRLQPYLGGMHVHDVAPPATDHVMPPRGQIDFQRFQSIGASDIVRVIEPSQRTPREEVVEALAFLQSCWGPQAASPAPAPRKGKS
jgi:sugar phosphate isomerase/epimerase